MLDWNQAREAGPSVAGGKGWNLGRLHRYGFPVPRGGVLPAQVYERLMSEGVMPALSKELRGVAAEGVTEPAVMDTLSALREAIRTATLPADAVGAVRAFLYEYAMEDVPLAVRSSATAEDGATASFAGMHQSFLGVTGLDAVLESVKGCYASLWTPQAVAYRRRMGLDDLDVNCAVVLCEMVGAEGDPHRGPVAAGVAFSCDPRTGRVDVVTISAGKGLGDAVVSGKTDPEEITVAQWGEAGRPQIIGRVSPEGQVLSDEAALTLAHLVLRIHWALGDGQDPQDVEWAYDGSRFSLLQARPVTTPVRRLPEGAEHLPVIWSNANLKDAAPGVLTPLTASLLLPAIRDNAYMPQQAAACPIPPGLENLRRFSGRAYFNLTAPSWLIYDAFGVTPAQVNRNMGGHQPEIPVPDGNPFAGKEGRRRKAAGFRLLRALWRLERRSPKQTERIFRMVHTERGRDVSGVSALELRLESERWEREFAGFLPGLLLSIAGVWQDMLDKALERAAPEKARSIASGLMSGMGKVVSAEHGYRLYDLAAAASAEPEAKACLEAEPLDPWGWRGLLHQSNFRREMERFLDDFGHRAVYEAEIANPRWHEDPSYLLEQVRMLVKDGIGRDPRAQGVRAQARAKSELSQCPLLWRPVVRWLARRTQRWWALREAAKSAVIALLEPVRKLHLEVGRRMHRAGLLDAPGDIFYLTKLDAEAYLRGWWDGTGARALIADRREQRERWLAESPPDVLVVDGRGRAVPWSPDQMGAVDGAATRRVPAVDGKDLIGVAVASGRVSGLARVLMHPDEGGRLQPGEVLVAPSTDPGWTPLFLRAAGLVMEHGGYLSHGAIVAREFGIPAVTNIAGVLNTMEDGEAIVVDGDAGKVSRSPI